MGALRRKLATETALDAERLRLVFCGRRLADDMCVRDLSLGEQTYVCAHELYACSAAPT